MKLDDLALGIMVLLGAIAVLISSTFFSPLPGQAYGADTMPRAIGVAGLLLGLVLITRAIRAGDRVPQVSRSDWSRASRPVARLALTLALVATYIVLTDTIGFIPVAIAILLVLMLSLEVRPVVALPVAICAAIVIQFAFARLLLVPLPRSPLIW